MSETAPSDALTLLVYALDEMRETTSLLRVADLGRSSRRPWWRNVFYAFARSRAEVSAGLAVQYLGENIDRARDHWHEALALVEELHQSHRANEVVEHTVEELHAAGLNDVLPRLQHAAIPSPIARAGAHLDDVVSTIRECDRILLSARSKLMLQRMRSKEV